MLDRQNSPQAPRLNFTYVQGMNVLAAPFLYTLPSELEAFYCFSRFIEVSCPLYVQPTLEGVHRGLKVWFSRSIIKEQERVYDYLLTLFFFGIYSYLTDVSKLSMRSFIHTCDQRICQRKYMPSLVSRSAFSMLLSHLKHFARKLF